MNPVLCTYSVHTYLSSTYSVRTGGKNYVLVCPLHKKYVLERSGTRLYNTIAWYEVVCIGSYKYVQLFTIPDVFCILVIYIYTAYFADGAGRVQEPTKIRSYSAYSAYVACSNLFIDLSLAGSVSICIRLRTQCTSTLARLVCDSLVLHTGMPSSCSSGCYRDNTLLKVWNILNFFLYVFQRGK